MSEDSEEGAPRTPSFDEAFYRDCPGQPIPLHEPDRVIDGRQRGKSPLDRNWQGRDYRAEGFDPVAHAASGGNVGMRPPEKLVIVDVDPRNFPEGEDMWALVKEEMDVDEDLYPVVHTPSGGKHVYMSVPPGVRLREGLPGRPGVEIKQGPRRQVVAAGSIHPDGGRYEADPLASGFPAAPMPPKMLAAARRPEASAAVGGGGEYAPAELATMLGGLSPEDYRDQAKWLELMMACHHATAGEGRDEFVEWSTGDPEYSSHGGKIGHRWDSLGMDKPVSVTHLTLLKALHKAGRAELIPRRAGRDFEADPLTGADLAAVDALAEHDWERQPPTLTRGAWLRRYNRRYALVRVGSDVRVLVRPRRPDGEQVFLKVPAFHALRVADRFATTVKRAEPAEGEEGASAGREETKVEQASLAWMRSGRRATYQGGITFRPDVVGDVGSRLNTWAGWAVEPRPGDWSRMKWHLYDVVCRRDRMNLVWLLCWIADLLQNPADKPGTAVVLRGEEGAGKSILTRYLRALCPRNSVSVSKPEQVVGRFNRHLAGSVLTVMEETFFAGNKAAESVLKDLITSETQVVEPKGVDAFEAPNHQRVVLITNAEWAVPASATARRFHVLDVSDHRLGDKAYFDALVEQMDGGGLAAMMHDLLRLRIPGWVNLRRPPQSRWLVEQKVRSLEAHEEWWHACVTDEAVAGLPWPEWLPLDEVYGDYCGYANGRRLRPLSRTELGIFLVRRMGLKKGRDYVKDDVTGRNVVDPRTGKPVRENRYYFPPVEEARERMEEKLGLKVTEPDEEMEGRLEEFPVTALAPPDERAA